MLEIIVFVVDFLKNNLKASKIRNLKDGFWAQCHDEGGLTKDS